MKNLPQTKKLLDHYYARLVDAYFSAREMHKNSEKELLDFIDEHHRLKTKVKLYQIFGWFWFVLASVFYFWR